MRLHQGFWLCVVLLACSSCAPIGDTDNPIPAGPAPVQPPQVGNIGKPQNQQPENDQQPALDGLGRRLRDVLDHIHNRELLTTHSFWTVIHGVLANGMETRLRDPISGKEFNAVDYIADGGRLNGLSFTPTADGVDVQILPLYGQGHQDQFIGEMTQAGMPIDKEFIVGGKEYTFEAFLKEAKAHTSVTKNQELSWTVIALSHYYGTDFSWTNRYGEKLHFEDAVRYELNQPIETQAACGGTHRLFGLTWAYHTHLKNGGKTTGVWKDVVATTEKYRDRAREYQNSDGTFSTDYFQKPANAPDAGRRIGSTGHIIEWLSLALSDEELREPWMQEAVHALIRLYLDNENRTLDAGGLYHAAHGLHLYYTRVYDTPKPGSRGAMIPLPPKAQ